MEKLSIEHCRPLPDDEDAYGGTVDPRTLEELPLDNPIEMTRDLTDYKARLRQKREELQQAAELQQDATTADAWNEASNIETAADDKDWNPEADGDAEPQKTWTPYTHQVFPTSDVRRTGTTILINGQQEFVSHTRPSRLESHKIPCVIDVNDRVAGYPQNTLTTMGGHFDPSVTTYISIVQSSTLPMSIRIRHVFKYKTSTHVAYLITIPITAFVESPRIEDHASNADEQRARLFPGVQEVSFCSSMRLVVNVRMADVWMRCLGAPPAREDTADLKTLLDAWRKNIEQDTAHVQFGFSMPSGQIVLTDYILPAIDEYASIQQNPKRAWAAAREFFRDPKNIKQLGWKTLNVNTPRPDTPNAPQVVFTTEIARLLAMQMSSYEELEIDLSNAAQLESRVFKSLFLPDVTSGWSPEDGNSFGIESDGTVQSYVVVIPHIEEVDREFIPEVGQPLKLSVGIAVPTPRIHPKSEPQPRLPTLLALRRLMTEAHELNLVASSKISETTDNDVKQRAIQNRDYSLAFRLASVLPKPIPAELRINQGLPDSMNDEQARIICATTFLDKFFPVRGNDKIWEGELMNTFTFDLSMPSLDLEPPQWSGVRIKPPMHAPSSAVYILVKTPREVGWPQQLIPPPMPYKLPKVDLSGSWEKVIGDISEDTQITVSMFTDLNDTTTQAEMAATLAMAQAKLDTFRGKLWDYTATFSTETSIDITTLLPLQDFRPDVDNSPHQPLYDALKELPAGMLAYTGGPGSGKTTFGLQLVRHLTNAKPSAHVIWTVHSNELCDDTASKLGQVKGNSVKVARVYPMRRMIQSLAGRHGSMMKSTKPTAKTPALPQTAAGIVSAIDNHVRQVARDDPMSRADSLVIRALLTAEADPGFHTLMQLRGKATLTEEEWKLMTVEIHRLIASVLATVNIIVGTPVALSQLGNCSKLVTGEVKKWDADVIVIDDAARMPEAQAWIPIATFDTKLVIMMGDTRQFKPMSKSLDNQGRGADDAKWHSTFGPQRVMSLLRRAEKVGATAYHVNINRRNLGQIAVWAKHNVYNGRMEIIYGSGLLVDLFRTTVNKILRLESSLINSYVVNIGEGEETYTKPSYANVANRNYCFRLIFRLFRTGFPCTTDVNAQGSIMVITPYSGQLAEYMNDWNKYKVDPYMKQNVSFRTIDNSMSAEADIVILDTVRTEKLGFIPMTPRMAVATTRARGAMITLLNVKDWVKKKGSIATFAKVNHMVSYFNWHFYYKAVADTQYSKKGWAMVCTKCGGPGHLEEYCKSTRKCRNRECNGTHDARFCPGGFQCRPKYTQRKDKANAKSTDSVTPGPVVTQIVDGRLHPTARRTRAQIVANSIDIGTAPTSLPVKSVETTDVRQDMHNIYQIVSANEDAKNIKFLTDGHGQDNKGFDIDNNPTAVLENEGKALGTGEDQDDGDEEYDGDDGHDGQDGQDGGSECEQNTAYIWNTSNDEW
ncbi:hypothetical protein LZ31DRAFT_619833 [Colletotrichum somersetense]|nr:hypothetical protein LZ31DRAFT_619833 [Colletotrichum somersetense]